MWQNLANCFFFKVITFLIHFWIYCSIDNIKYYGVEGLSIFFVGFLNIIHLPRRCTELFREVSCLVALFLCTIQNFCTPDDFVGLFFQIHLHTRPAYNYAIYTWSKLLIKQIFPVVIEKDKKNKVNLFFFKN